MKRLINSNQKGDRRLVKMMQNSGGPRNYPSRHLLHPITPNYNGKLINAPQILSDPVKKMNSYHQENIYETEETKPQSLPSTCPSN